MKISGTKIAESIFSDLKKRTDSLKKQHITPHLVVIFVGSDPASQSYITQKQRKAEAIGAIVTVLHYPETVTTSQLLQKISELNDDTSVHGIIVQRPLPPHIDMVEIDYAVIPTKDIDGFHPESHFRPPVALAVMQILEYIATEQQVEKKDFFPWIKAKTILVIGKGEAGGRPILAHLHELGLTPFVISSKTINPHELIERADIIISAVGKKKIVKPEQVKKGAILISVGMHKGEDKKIHADYEEEKIDSVASFYTPSPGGVGPVNVAMLLSNLLLAAEHNS